MLWWDRPPGSQARNRATRKSTISSSQQPARTSSSDATKLVAGEGMEVDELRASVMLALVQRRPLVIHDMDDEIAMVRLCEMLWPGKRISKLRAAVEAESRTRGDAVA